MRNFAIKLVTPPPGLLSEQNPDGLKYVTAAAVSAAQGFLGFYGAQPENKIVFAAPLANVLYFFEY